MAGGPPRVVDLHGGVHATQLTLGILAGGRATRLGGLDKAWLQRSGEPQVLRLLRAVDGEVSRVLVSANTGLARYAAHCMDACTDRTPDLGPIGGLDALAHACTTAWLVTLPVDLVGINDCLLRSLVAGAAPNGATAVDDDGPQPLVALWRVQPMREAIASALQLRSFAVHDLQSTLGMSHVRFTGLRFGNLNTPEDLVAAGVAAG